MKYAKNVIIILTVFCTQFLFADAPAWDTDNDCVLDTYNFYENNGSITAKIFPNGEEGGAMGDMIAAFVDGEQRGVGCASEVPVFLGNGVAFLTMVYSNATSGETLTFQYYDASEDSVHDAGESIEFTSNMVEGDVTDPFVLSYTAGDDGDGGGSGGGDYVSSGTPAWYTDNDCVLDTYNFYENNGSITAKIFPNGEEGGAMGDMIAAFVDGEQRGVGCASEVPVFLGNGVAFLTMVYSNATSGETLTFQYYDASEDAVYNTNETIEFTSNMVEGDVTDPFVLTYNPGDGGGPSDTPGCTDDSACNYDSNATADDGSCEYAAENYDCDGNCSADV